jgi:hypothetical protein
LLLKNILVTRIFIAVPPGRTVGTPSGGLCELRTMGCCDVPEAEVVEPVKVLELVRGTV